MLSDMDHYELLERVQVVAGATYERVRDERTGEAFLVVSVDARRGASAKEQIAALHAKTPALLQTLAGLAPHQNIAMMRGALTTKVGVAYDDYPGIPLDLWRARYAAPSQYDVIEFGLALLDVLAFAHDRGVLHRALSASMVWVEDAPTLRLQTVYGFGFAQLMEAEKTWSQTATIQADVRFMAPEQFTGETWGEGTDLYAVALILHRLLSDTPAVSGDSIFAQIQVHCEGRLAPITPEERASSALRAVIARATQRHRVDRYVNAREMMHALRAERQHATRILPQVDATADQFSSQETSQKSSLPPSRAGEVEKNGRAHRSRFRRKQGSAGRHARAIDLDGRRDEAAQDVLQDHGDTEDAAQRAASRFPWKTLFGAWLVAMLIGGALLARQHWAQHIEDERNEEQAMVDDVPPETCRWENVARSLAVGETQFEVSPEHKIVFSYDRMTIRVFDRSAGTERPLRYIRAFAGAQVWHRHTYEAGRDWFYVVPEVRHAQRPSIWALQFQGNELLTSQRIPLSTETVADVRMDLRVREDRCLLWVRVTGDRGIGPAEKEAWFRMTDPGLVVEFGALGGLWAPDLDESPL